MFILELYDRDGNKLNIGDYVAISDGKNFTFYSEVKYLADKGVITPFHTFSFHSFIKVDSIPDNAIKSTELSYDIWYVSKISSDNDKNGEAAREYLMSWRECEIPLQKRCWRIKLQTEQLELF